MATNNKEVFVITQSGDRHSSRVVAVFSDSDEAMKVGEKLRASKDYEQLDGPEPVRLDPKWSQGISWFLEVVWKDIEDFHSPFVGVLISLKMEQRPWVCWDFEQTSCQIWTNLTSDPKTETWKMDLRIHYPSEACESMHVQHAITMFLRQPEFWENNFSRNAFFRDEIHKAVGGSSPVA